MKEMLSFLIARDTMHQQQWLAVIEDLGGLQGALPMPNSFPQTEEDAEVQLRLLRHRAQWRPAEPGRWTEGPSMDGKGQFSVFQNEPMGEAPVLGPAREGSGAQQDRSARNQASKFTRSTLRCPPSVKERSTVFRFACGRGRRVEAERLPNHSAACAALLSASVG